MDILFSVIQIIFADIVLSGDNALVIGMAAAGLAPKQRQRAIFLGMAVAAGLRIVFAITASYLLTIKGIRRWCGSCSLGCAGVFTTTSKNSTRNLKKISKRHQKKQNPLKALKARALSVRSSPSLWLMSPCRLTISWLLQRSRATTQPCSFSGLALRF